MSRYAVRGTLSAAVADAATFTVGYPTAAPPELALAMDEGDFYNAMGHQLVIGQNSALVHPRYFDITLGTSVITVTNKTGATWAAGDKFELSLETPGRAAFASARDMGPNVRIARAGTMGLYLINLGSPDALVTDGIAAAQNRTGAGALTIDGSLASGGSVTLDKPRNFIIDSGGADTAVITVTGYDEYGVLMKESATLNGTTAVAGKKAFKKITAIASSTTIANTAFIGTGDVLGLPVWLPAAGHVIKELQNGTAATAGTFVAGWQTAGAHTATGADVRGTYDANAALDGALTLQLIVALSDAGFLGTTQYS